jgi:pyridoxal phosphate enzyme (YggS family)
VIDAAEVAARAAEVRARIESAGGDPARITVVAVTKAFGPDAVTAAIAAGLHDVGENYAQELAAKARDLEDATAVRWHFIGQLQRNKVRTIAPFVHLWQSVDRLSLGEEIARRAPGAAVLIQVNAEGEPGKGGCSMALAPGVVDGCRDLGLDVRGLMAVGPTAGGPEAARPAFEAVRALADRLGLAERSMGMTADLEVAVRAGSTMVRVGSALFGARPPRP